MSNTTNETPIPTLGNIGAPGVFADGCIGVFLTNGNIHMTFASRRCDYGVQPAAFSDAVIGRRVMPVSAAENTIQFLGDFITRMKAHAAITPADTDPNRILQ